MAQRSHVPAFGDWDNDGNVPYTVFFEKARKGRGGAPIRNPNDPEENPDIFSAGKSDSHEAPLPPSKPKNETEEPRRQGTVKSTHERRQSREDGGFRQYANSPGHRENPGRRPSGSEYSVDRSPLHRQAKGSGRDSPSWEGKGFEGGRGNAGKTRMRPLTRNDTSEGTAIPKFGSWDVNNPASADGFTHIFSKVRDQRMGPGSSPVAPSSPYNNNVNRHQPDDTAKGCCFPWCRK